jgi:hypothetical protein
MGRESVWEVRVGAIQKNDIDAIIGIILANHIKNTLVFLVWEDISTIKGSKEENRSVNIWK